MNNTGTGQN